MVKPEDHSVKNERKTKLGIVPGPCLRAEKKLRNLKVMLLPIIAGKLGTDPNALK